MTGMILPTRRHFLAGAAALAATPAAAQARKPVAKPAAPSTRPEVPIDEAKLPAGTRDMLARIRNAARTGDINRLRIPIERNEVPPIFKRGGYGDPIALLKARSADGEGREMLHLLLRVLDTPCTIMASPIAPMQYMWPFYANTPFAARSPADQSASWGLVRLADIGLSTQMREPLIHRIIIGAEGTWQVFAAL